MVTVVLQNVEYLRKYRELMSLMWKRKNSFTVFEGFTSYILGGVFWKLLTIYRLFQYVVRNFITYMSMLRWGETSGTTAENGPAIAKYTY
jgi:hypothetical protein